MIEWKFIEGTDEHYSISNQGQVRSNQRTVIRCNGKPHTVKERILKPGLDEGYEKVSIFCNGRYQTKKVHRLVADAFIPNIDNKPQVNHISGITDDNNVSNLEWVTNQENQLHSYNTLGRIPKKGEQNGNSKLTQDAVNEIREHANNSGRNYGRKALAEKYGVSEGTIKEIVTYRIWK